MADLRTLVRDEMDRAGSPSYSFDDLGRRRDRRERNRRLAAALVAVGLALATFAGLIQILRTTERPADEPTPSPSGEDIFAHVHGWIVYGNPAGVFSVNPTRRGDPEGQVQLSHRGGEPLAWSSDGTKLLISRYVRVPGADNNSTELIVLNADGTETRLTDSFSTGGSFSPDGTHVVYAPWEEFPSRIYAIDVESGTQKMLLAASRRLFPALGRGTLLFVPAFSPDGTKVAFFAGGYDHSNRLWVMDADGSDAHVLLDDPLPGFIHHLVWSPDGTRLAFDMEVYGSTERTGIYIVDADGSDLRLAIFGGTKPHWSPDGSRISYRNLAFIGTLEIARRDGTHVQKFGYGGSGPWNPLPLSEPGDGEPTATRSQSRSRVAPFVYAGVVLGAVVILLVGIGTQRRRLGDRTSSE